MFNLAKLCCFLEKHEILFTSCISSTVTLGIVRYSYLRVLNIRRKIAIEDDLRRTTFFLICQSGSNIFFLNSLLNKFFFLCLQRGIILFRFRANSCIAISTISRNFVKHKSPYLFVFAKITFCKSSYT